MEDISAFFTVLGAMGPHHCATLHVALQRSVSEAWRLAASAAHGGAGGLAGLPTAALSHPDPFVACLFLLAFVVLLCWLWSLPTGNCSHVDRMWSLVPVAYVGLIARQDVSELLQGRPADARLLLQLALVAAWGARLTYNFARKGGYRLSFEDYRWEQVRRLLFPAGPLGALLFQVFNLVFIAAAQHVLCLLICTPAYVSWQFRTPGAPLQPLDVLAACLVAHCILGEAVADQQQWEFHAEKQSRLAAAAAAAGPEAETTKAELLSGDYGRGFLASSGLWQYSRHPNFFFEQATWWCMHLFAVSASGCLFHWTLAGPVFLTCLFHFSANFTERLSATKYPLYRQYQRTTSRLLPWLPGPPLPEVSPAPAAAAAPAAAVNGGGRRRKAE